MGVAGSERRAEGMRWGGSGGEKGSNLNGVSKVRRGRLQEGEG